MAYFPFMMDMNNRKCVIAGGGKVAAGKAETMLMFGACVTVVSPVFSQYFYDKFEESDRIILKEKEIDEKDLEGAFCCIMATDDPVVNSRMARICREKGILVNVVDVKDECDFYFPAIVKQDEVVISVSTGGESPALAAHIKRDIRDSLYDGYGRVSKKLGQMREDIISNCKCAKDRKKVFENMIMEEKKIVKIGTRGSKLALIQTDMLIDKLKKIRPDLNYEKVIISTRGDKILDKPLASFGGKAVFVDEFENAISEGLIDMAVHSAKDMPGQLKKGLVVAGVLERADVRDVLITKRNSDFDKYIKGEADNTKSEEAGNINGHDIGNIKREDIGNIDGRDISKDGEFLVGTGSLRRECQIKAIYDRLCVALLRGNVNTRIDKLKDGQYDGIILAAAGIKRMGLDKEEDLSYHYFSKNEMVPSGCQGIIAVETKEYGLANKLAEEISDEKTMQEFVAERYLLEVLEAGCHEAVGVISEVNDDVIELSFMKMIDGQIIKNTVTGPVKDYRELALSLTKGALE